MYCSNCGTEIPKGVKFCYECGTPVTTQENEKSVEPTPTAPISVTVAPVDVSTASVHKNMAAWKIVSGILSFIIPIIILFQSCAVGMIGAFGEDTGGGGSSGVIVAIFMIAAGIVSIVTRKARGGNIAIVGICGIGAILGYGTRGIYEDLVVWSSWLVIMAIMAVVCFFLWKEYVPASEENKEEADAQRAKKTKRQNTIMIITLVVLLLFSPVAWSSGSNKTSVKKANSTSVDANSTTDKQSISISAEEPSDNIGAEKQRDLPSNVCSSQGYTIEIVALHTAYVNGEPVAIIEFTFQNDNPEPTSFSSASYVQAFQNGMELDMGWSSDLYDLNYDWNGDDRDIKDGAKITAFVVKKLENTIDSVEVTAKIWSWSLSGDDANASASVVFEWDNNEEAQGAGQTYAEYSSTLDGSRALPQNVCSANGYTVDIVAAHLAEDTDGKPVAVIELAFQNDNPESESLLTAADIKMFQNGTEKMAYGINLTPKYNDYDWTAYNKCIENGDKIIAFIKRPLDNTTDPIEVTAKISRTDENNPNSSASAIFELS